MSKPEHDSEKYIASFLDNAFEDIAHQLDSICDQRGLTSDNMECIVGEWGDFKSYYSDWIRETWEPEERK